MRRHPTPNPLLRTLMLVAAALAIVPVALRRAGPAGWPGTAGRSSGTARSAAPVDLTGQWVSVVTEDWRWRMVTPPKGDYASVPLNPEGRKAADAWDLSADNAAGNQCRAFGAAGLMRMPTRVRISWQDDNTLKLESDAGQQTRLFRFETPDAVRHRDVDSGAAAGRAHVAGRVGRAVVPSAAVARAGIRRPRRSCRAAACGR